MGTGGMRCGAGRPGWHVRAEHCLRLDVRDLARRKLLNAGYFGWHWTDVSTSERRSSIGVTALGGEIRLNFTVDGGESVSQSICIERTPCHYGGARPWFQCPRCGRRIAVLFLRSGAFMCRHCGRVAYSSQSDDEIGKTWRREHRLERRLGPNWKRPKGMHHRTYRQIIDAIVDCQQRRDGALADFLFRMDGRLRRLGHAMGLDQ